MPFRGPAQLRLLLLLSSFCLIPAPAAGLARFDFEQAYLTHRGRQVWDFCLVRHADAYHCFYHTAPDTGAKAARGDTIWHATAPDLTHWRVLGPALVNGEHGWEDGGIWAPDVVQDSTSGRWAMMYTAADPLRVQRPCLAWSDDLHLWTREPANPLFEPDSTLYRWSPTLAWSAFRDPFLFRHEGRWQMLSTAFDSLGVGILHRAESPDLVDWSEGGIFLRRGAAPGLWRAMESSQLVVRDGRHHVFWSDYDQPGVKHIASDTLAWDWAARDQVDWGFAAEIKSFDPGATIFARLAIDQYPLTGAFFFTVRFDTMEFPGGGLPPRLRMPHPLDAVWEERVGLSSLAQPTFGDNPAFRGEPSCGLVGNGWYGSQEYYQGPLSGRGKPGVMLGDAATGSLRSRPFTLQGNSIRLLVGGGDYPQTCYVALVDAETDSVLMSETGRGEERMTARTWFTEPLRGRSVRIVIVDAETGPFGHINVDEIEESMDVPAGLAAAGEPVLEHRARPNPFNAATEVAFTLAGPAAVRLEIHDLRGRLVWRSDARPCPAGPGTIRWAGRDRSGRPAPAGSYLYGLVLDGRRAAAGRLSMLK